MTTNTYTRAAGANATGLTYAERTLIAGEFNEGLRHGYEEVSGRAQVVREARATYAEFRARFGYAGHAAMLTQPDAQAKLGKSDRHALGLMLTPSDANPEDVNVKAGLRRRFTLCSKASAGCRAACLAYSGHGAFTATQRARQVRTAFLLAKPYAAAVLIGHETRRARETHGHDRVTLRLNVLSDIRFEFVAARALNIIARNGVRVYDYTAHAPSARNSESVYGYTLVYSAKETAHTSDDYLAGILESGRNVAMPFHVGKHDALPTTYTLDGRVFRVIDGDLSDDRTEDTQGVIVGLRAKGSRGKADASGFIRTV